MSCRGAKKSLLDYADGRLPEKEREAVRLHLESCPSCEAAAEKLELSASALSSTRPPELGDAASERILANIGREVRPEGSRAGWWRSQRVLAAGAAVAAVLVAVVVVVGVEISRNTGETERSTTGAAEDQASQSAFKSVLPESAPSVPAATATGQNSGSAAPLASVAMPLPAVKASSTDYDQASLRSMVESLPARKQYADAYTMSDAAVLSGTYARKAADDFAHLGQSGPELEAMISYVTASEPVLLTCYVESALFGGRPVWVIGLAAPPRNGSSVKLSRTEVWVLDPARFTSDPDSSIVFFLEYK